MTYSGPATPLTRQGTKIGLHSMRPRNVIPLVQAAHDRGAVWPFVKAVDNAGTLTAVKGIEKRTPTLLRRVNELEDGCQGVETWTDADMRVHARRVLDFAWVGLSNAEKDATDWIEPINEADPPGVGGYRAYGDYLNILIEQATQRGIKLALPALNAGTPEWAEMQALLSTGCGAAIKQSGGLWTAHEGPTGGQSVQYGFGDVIPGAPVVAGAGSLAFRCVNLAYQLNARGELAPFLISEWYGGAYNLSPLQHLARMQWYDALARKFAWLLAFLPFTIDPSPKWAGADYSAAFLYAVADYLYGEKDVTNTTDYPAPNPPLYPPGTTHVVGNCQLVNVRNWPFTGDPPPIIRQLAVGTPVRAYGLYQTPSMTNGWRSISPSSKEWVRADFLLPVAA